MDIKQHMERRLSALESERASWESQWRDLARYFLPHRARFLDGGDHTNKGDRRNNSLFDSTGRLAARTLAGGMQSGLTSPSRPWFQLALQDDESVARDDVKQWLHDTYSRMMGVFRQSNFYEQIHTLYGELAVFGTGCMLVEEDKNTVVRFRTLTVGEYSLDTDASGRVNTLYRRTRMTPAQIAESWPETCPQRVKEQAGRNTAERLEVLHMVEPNPDYREGLPDRDDAQARPFRSVYLLLSGDKEVLEESGYYEFPALCPRWETTGADVYGRSPAMDALPDCRMLQRLAKDGLEALELEVRPPLNITTGGNEPVDISPAALNYLPPAAAGQQSVTPLYQVRANLAALESYKTAIQNQIKEALFTNLFMMLANIDRGMTATEVAERNAEKMLMLGPVLDRMRSEIFQPLIVRVGGLMLRLGLLAPRPEALNGQGIGIEFVSILAQAQKQAGMTAISQVMLTVGQLAQMHPEVLDKLDSDEVVDEIAAMLGAPPKLIRSDEAVARLRLQRREREQQANMMGMLGQGADILGKGGPALKQLLEIPAAHPAAQSPDQSADPSVEHSAQQSAEQTMRQAVKQAARPAHGPSAEQEGGDDATR